MTPQEFVEKWRRANLSERSACQQHFLDLCELLGQEKPAAADPDGAWYTFERGVTKTEGGNGWADVWMKDHFGWEYKGKHKDLVAAYRQLLLYREDLDNPPLLVVCDLNRFEIHTNFTGTAKRIYAFDLDGLTKPENLDTLRKLFTEPDALKPGQTAIGITEGMANLFGRIADGMRVRGIEAHAAAHFLMKLMFCMFGEDIGLLPDKVFSTVLNGTKINPTRLSDKLRALFAAMAEGGDFGAVTIPYFNGGLFSNDEVFDLSIKEIEELIAVNSYDWSSVEPSIFGTLFERTLDPDKRAQIGAHYTSRADIVTLLEPVVMAPLRREWGDVRGKCDKIWEEVQLDARKSNQSVLAVKGRVSTAKKKDKKTPRVRHDKPLQDFLEHLAHITILDPACGSGNFLYVSINLLLELEKEVIAYAASHGTSLLPQVRPTQLLGIEINPYAQQLAQVVIWIGYLQWMHHNGFNAPSNPILEPIENIRLMDAILDLSDPENPKEPQWPKADFIIGNPPFLGNRLMAAHYDESYLLALYQIYEDRLGGRPDLCCYWFEKARDQIALKRSRRAGLLATQGIRGGTNRNVLKRIKSTGELFFAIADREWILDGAMVHVSMVGFDDGSDTSRVVDGQSTTTIHSNLSSGADTTQAQSIGSNAGISFQGGIKRGSFDVSDDTAMALLHDDGNPNNRPNSDVLLPYLNATDVTRHNRHVWIIHIPELLSLDQAASYHKPFEYLRRVVQPERQSANQQSARDHWWVHWNIRTQLERELKSLKRWIVTPRVSKHRLFAWVTPPNYIDNALVAYARDDDYTFGILHSRVHEVWSRAQGTQLRERESGFRYTPTTCFETFPFPEPTLDQRNAIESAAIALDQLRNNWLYPSDWTGMQLVEFRGTCDGPWRSYLDKSTLDERGVGTVRYPRLVARDIGHKQELEKRSLTNLYNERPKWLELAHQELDAAVFAAYGFEVSRSDEELLESILSLNLERAAL